MEIEKREIPIDWEGRKETVVIKKLSYGDVLDLREESTDLKFIGAIPQIKFNSSKYEQLSVLKSLMKAPFKIEMESIRQLPKEVGELLSKEVNEFSNLGEKKNLISSGQSKQEIGTKK